jgi:hypothetical protein
MPRYFKYRYSQQFYQLGPYSNKLYFFSMTTVTEVDNNQDAEVFLHMGSPESGYYLFRETDATGKPIGAFPPIDPKLRSSNINPKLYPTDTGAPSAEEWRMATEVLSDPVLYFHHVRQWIRR